MANLHTVVAPSQRGIRHTGNPGAAGAISVGVDAEGSRGVRGTTSTVSQQIAALAKEAGEQLIEPDGRRVRLTPAGRRLADHAVTILAAVDAARLDLDPDAEPAGTVRVGGFATGIRVSLWPIVRELTVSHPRVKVAISEYEPLEAFDLLVDDDLDLAITYDYNLAPAAPDPVLEVLAV